MRINKAPFQVIGLLKSKGQSGSGMDQDDIVFIPLTTAQSRMMVITFVLGCFIDWLGMVTIALASLIIGETLVGKHSVLRRIVGVILGSCLYRFAIAIALRLHVPAECLKLVSAVIVAIAIASPYLKQQIAFQKRKLTSASSAKGGDGVC